MDQLMVRIVGRRSRAVILRRVMAVDLLGKLSAGKKITSKLVVSAGIIERESLLAGGAAANNAFAAL